MFSVSVSASAAVAVSGAVPEVSCVSVLPDCFVTVTPLITFSTTPPKCVKPEGLTQTVYFTSLQSAGWNQFVVRSL